MVKLVKQNIGEKNQCKLVIYHQHISSNEKDIKRSKSKATALTGINWEESLGDILIMFCSSPLSKVLQPKIILMDIDSYLMSNDKANALLKLTLRNLIVEEKDKKKRKSGNSHPACSFFLICFMKFSKNLVRSQSTVTLLD